MQCSGGRVGLLWQLRGRRTGGGGTERHQRGGNLRSLCLGSFPPVWVLPSIGFPAGGALDKRLVGGVAQTLSPSLCWGRERVDSPSSLIMRSLSQPLF